MDTLELMDSCVSSYSKTDRNIYESIRKFPDAYAHQTITEISEGSHCSKAALTRFAKRLGFNGFAEFQYQLRQDLESHRDEAPTNAEVYASLLTTVDERIDRERLRALAERIISSQHVFPIGTNLSRIPAEELHMALAHSPEVFSVLSPSDVIPNYCKDDVVIVYSAISGYAHRWLARVFDALGDNRPHAVLVTTNSKHPLRRIFDETFVLPTATLVSGTHAVLSDTFAFLMFNDALVSILEGKG